MQPQRTKQLTKTPNLHNSTITQPSTPHTNPSHDLQHNKPHNINNSSTISPILNNQHHRQPQPLIKLPRLQSQQPLSRPSPINLLSQQQKATRRPPHLPRLNRIHTTPLQIQRQLINTTQTKINQSHRSPTHNTSPRTTPRRQHTKPQSHTHHAISPNSNSTHLFPQNSPPNTRNQNNTNTYPHHQHSQPTRTPLTPHTHRQQPLTQPNLTQTNHHINLQTPISHTNHQMPAPPHQNSKTPKPRFKHSNPNTTQLIHKHQTLKRHPTQNLHPHTTQLHTNANATHYKLEQHLAWRIKVPTHQNQLTIPNPTDQKPPEQHQNKPNSTSEKAPSTGGRHTNSHNTHTHHQSQSNQNRKRRIRHRNRNHRPISLKRPQTMPIINQQQQLKSQPTQHLQRRQRQHPLTSPRRPLQRLQHRTNQQKPKQIRHQQYHSLQHQQRLNRRQQKPTNLPTTSRLDITIPPK